MNSRAGDAPSRRAEVREVSPAPPSPAPWEKLWEMASPDGKTISKDKAVDYVINFDMVNSEEDATLEADEFNKTCSEGMIKADAATVKDMN